MKNLQYNRFLGALLLASICGFMQAQPGERPPNALPGSCYAKALIPDEYEDLGEEVVYVYHGEDSTIIADFTIDKSIVLGESRSRWVSRKADRNCLSADPNDCLVWCLVYTDPEVLEADLYLTDTTVTKEFETIYYNRRKLVRKGGFTEWREIVCENEITLELLDEIRIALGMPYEEYNITFDSETKVELVKYQKMNSLPVGQIDFETLRHMGIDWW